MGTRGGRRRGAPHTGRVLLACCVCLASAAGSAAAAEYRDVTGFYRLDLPEGWTVARTLENGQVIDRIGPRGEPAAAAYCTIHLDVARSPEAAGEGLKTFLLGERRAFGRTGAPSEPPTPAALGPYEALRLVDLVTVNRTEWIEEWYAFQASGLLYCLRFAAAVGDPLREAHARFQAVRASFRAESPKAEGTAGGESFGAQDLRHKLERRVVRVSCFDPATGMRAGGTGALIGDRHVASTSATLGMLDPESATLEIRVAWSPGLGIEERGASVERRVLREGIGIILLRLEGPPLDGGSALIPGVLDPPAEVVAAAHVVAPEPENRGTAPSREAEWRTVPLTGRAADRTTPAGWGLVAAEQPAALEGAVCLDPGSGRWIGLLAAIPAAAADALCPAPAIMAAFGDVLEYPAGDDAKAWTALDHFLLARIYRLQGRPDAAMARYHLACSGRPGQVPVFLEAAAFLAEMEGGGALLPPAARTWYAQAAALEPDCLPALVALGRDALQRDDIFEANGFVTRAARAAPTSPDVQRLLMETFDRSRETERAILAAREALKGAAALAVSQRAEIMASAASVLRRNGSRDEAQRILQEGLAMAPASRALHLALLDGLALDGNDAALERQYAETLRFLPDDPEVLRRLGGFYEGRRGKPERARDAYLKAWRAYGAVGRACPAAVLLKLAESAGLDRAVAPAIRRELAGLPLDAREEARFLAQAAASHDAPADPSLRRAHLALLARLQDLEDGRRNELLSLEADPGTALSEADLLRLVKSGYRPARIARLLEQSEPASDLEAADPTALWNKGVPAEALQAIENTRRAEQDLRDLFGDPELGRTRGGTDRKVVLAPGPRNAREMVLRLRAGTTYLFAAARTGGAGDPDLLLKDPKRGTVLAEAAHYGPGEVIQWREGEGGDRVLVVSCRWRPASVRVVVQETEAP